MAAYTTSENQILQLYISIPVSGGPDGKTEYAQLPAHLVSSIISLEPSPLEASSDTLRTLTIEMHETPGWLERRLMQQIMNERRLLLVKQFFVTYNEINQAKPVWVNSYTLRLNCISAPKFNAQDKTNAIKMTIESTVVEYSESPYIEPEQPVAPVSGESKDVPAEASPSTTESSPLTDSSVN